jgi:hypothetical protein
MPLAPCPRAIRLLCAQEKGNNFGSRQLFFGPHALISQKKTRTLQLRRFINNSKSPMGTWLLSRTHSHFYINGTLVCFT